MRKKRALAVYLLCMSAVALWLFGSTSLVVRLSGERLPQRVDLDEFLPALRRGDVISSTDFVQPANDLAESLGLFGWAFVETEYDNPDRYVSYLLKGERNCYELRCDNLIRRAEVLNVYKDKKIPNVMVGFGNDFTTAAMENGLYDVWLYCRENEQNDGLEDTGIWIEKNGAEIARTDYISEPLKPKKAGTQQGNVRWFINSFTTVGADVELKGWAFVEGQNCETQSVRVQISDALKNDLAYSADTYSIYTVAKEFDNADYKMSGFQARFPLKAMKDGHCTLSLLIENGGETWQSSQVGFDKSAEGVEMTSVQQGFRSQQVAQPRTPDAYGNLKQWMDKAEIEDGTVQVQGWAFIDGEACGEQHVYVSFIDGFESERQFTTQIWDRPDVAEIYGDAYLQSGYLARIPLDELSDGQYTLRITVENTDVTEASDVCTLSLREGNAQILSTP